jgi:hypothetical protein
VVVPFFEYGNCKWWTSDLALLELLKPDERCGYARCPGQLTQGPQLPARVHLGPSVQQLEHALAGAQGLALVG